MSYSVTSESELRPRRREHRMAGGLLIKADFDQSSKPASLMIEDCSGQGLGVSGGLDSLKHMIAAMEGGQQLRLSLIARGRVIKVLGVVRWIKLEGNYFRMGLETQPNSWELMQQIVCLAAYLAPQDKGEN